MMGLLIRKALPADAATIASIHCLSWEAAYSGFVPSELIAKKNAGRLEQWRQILSQPHKSYLALRNGVPVGFLSIFSPSRDPDLPNAGEIGAIYLLPEYWCMGIGHHLLQFGVKKLFDMGYIDISLWVFERNERARRFYEKNGFVIDAAINTRKPDSGVVEIRYRLRNPITPTNGDGEMGKSE